MKKALLIIGSIVVFICALLWSLPSPLSNDLQQIGQGKKSVVFVYDLNLVVSNEQTIEMNAAKSKLGDSVNFLVIRTGYPETEEFMRKYEAQSVELFFFDETGHAFMRKFAPVTAAELQRILTSVD